MLKHNNAKRSQLLQDIYGILVLLDWFAPTVCLLVSLGLSHFWFLSLIQQNNDFLHIGLLYDVCFVLRISLVNAEIWQVKIKLKFVNNVKILSF